MREIEKNISSLIQSQFPSFYNEEGEMFIAFVKAYYEWLEKNGNTLYHTRRLLDYKDIDRTINSFIRQFKEQYLKNIVFTTDSNKKLFIKHALEFYKSKGSPRSVDLFFRLIYGIPVQIYNPGEDLFRLSSAEYVNSQYIEVTQTEDNINFVGKQITGALSKATAFVDKLIKKKINSQNIDVFYISNIKKDFQVGEPVSYNKRYTKAPRIIGSLSKFEVITGGSNFEIGEIVDIDSTATGKQGKARVTSTKNLNGIVEFTFEEGGWGFSQSSDVIVSENVLTINSISTSDTLAPFKLFEKITQPLANISYNTLNGAFAVNDIVEKFNAGGTKLANGTILSLTQNTVSKTGQMLVGIISGNIFSGTSFIYKSGNSANASIVTSVDKTVTANIMGVSSNVTLHCVDYNGQYQLGIEVYQGNTTTEWANGIVTDIDGNPSQLVLTVSDVKGVFRPSTTNVYSRDGLAYSSLESFSTTIGVYNITNEFVSFPNNAVESTFGNKGKVQIISAGSSAGFSVANLINQEITLYNPDLIGSNNYAGISFMNSVYISNGSISGPSIITSSNGYGFTKNPLANLNSKIIDGLDFKYKEVGTIKAIGNIDQGVNYASDPYVTIIEHETASQDKKDYILNIENKIGNYTNGEIIKQVTQLSNVNVLTISSANGGFVIMNLTGIGGTFNLGETVYQRDGTNANVGFGTIRSINVSSGTGTITANIGSNVFYTSQTYKIIGATSSANAFISSLEWRLFEINERINQYQSDGVTLFANGIVQNISINPTARTGSITVNTTSQNFVTTSNYKIRGTLTTANAVVTAVDTSNPSVTAQGIIYSIPNASTLYAKRISMNNSFEVTPTGTIVGTLSGAVANLVGITRDDSRSGLNARVLTESLIGNGHVTALELVDSGFGYSNGDVLQFTSQDKTNSGTTKLILEKQGIGKGYFKDKKGFLSEKSYLFDGNFYQEYSYQILSRLPLEKYSRMFKKVLHMAGTEFFGGVVLEELATSEKNAADLNMKTTNAVFKDVSNTEVIEPNYYIYQVKNSTQIANGYIKDYPSAIILVKNTSPFEVNTLISQNTGSAGGSNSAYGYIQHKSTNSTHTFLYVSNTRGTFVTSGNLHSITQRSFTTERLIEISIRNVSSPSLSTQSFSIGQVVTTSGGFQGVVVAATSSSVRVTVTSGSLAINQTLTGGGTTAIITAFTASTFTTDQPAYQEIKTLFLTSIDNTFQVNESVYQEKPNLLTSSSVDNVNTATGKIVSTNSSAIQIVNVFGNFANNREVIGATSGASAIINGIITQNTAVGNVVSSTTTSLSLKDIKGTFVVDRHIKGANALANCTTLSTVTTSNIPSSNIESVINILVISNTQGTFAANSTTNVVTITLPDKITSTASANLTSVTIESL